MILLNTKSILNCDEEETKIHFKEIETLFEKLSTNNHLCIIKVDHLDPIQKIDKCSRLVQITMSELEDFIQEFDIKNGADVYNDNKHIVIKLYGQTYCYKGKDYIITTQLYVRQTPLRKEF